MSDKEYLKLYQLSYMEMKLGQLGSKQKWAKRITEMLLLRRMLKISYMDRATNEEVL